RPAKRDARDEDRHVRGDHPGVPPPRLRPVAHQAGPRLVGRAVVRAVHPGEERLRHPLSPDAALLSGYGSRLRVPGSVLPDLRARLHAAEVHRRHLQDAKNHKWYMEPRLVTVNDLYAFDPNAKVSIEPFEDIIGRHFKQPKEGLGYDNSSSAHMWRTLARPDNPL